MQGPLTELGTAGLISHLCAALAYTFLLAQLLTRWRGRVQSAPLAIASALSLAWAGSQVARYFFNVPTWLQQDFDLLRTLGWFLFIFALLDHSKQSRTWRYFKRLAYVCVALAVFFVSIAPTQQHSYENTLIVLFMILAALGLGATEQLIRHTPWQYRDTSYLTISLAGLFTYDFYLHAHQLIGQEEFFDLGAWGAKGGIATIAALLISLSVSRNQASDRYLQPSHSLVFYAASVSASIVVFTLSWTLATALQQQTSDWQSISRHLISFIALSAALLLTMAFHTNRQLQVWITKHLFSHKYDYRHEWLQLIERLSQPAEDSEAVYETALRAITDVLDCSNGLLFLRNDYGSYDLKSTLSPPLTDYCWNPSDWNPSEQSWLDALHLEQWICFIQPQSKQAAKRHQADTPGWIKQMPDAWVAAPLSTESQLEGFVILLNSNPLENLSWEDMDLLKTVCRQVASHLSRFQQSELLAEAKQFDTYHKLAAFIVHDLKNLIAQQSLVVANAAKHRDNPAFIDDAIATIGNSVSRMERLLSQFDATPLAGQQDAFDARQLAYDVAERCKTQTPLIDLQLPDESILIEGAQEQLQMVLFHLTRNAQQACESDGRVSISLTATHQYCQIVIQDNGCGMEEKFIRTQLFKPFYSRRRQQGMGIGAYQSREILHQHQGQLQVFSELDVGTRVELLLPRSPSTQSPIDHE